MQTDTRMATHRKPLLNIMAFILFGCFIFAIAIHTSVDDIKVYFTPTGRYLLEGQSPYVINEVDPFLYWPFGLWFFPPFALIPHISLLMLAVNSAALIAIIRRMKISWFWLLYPPALYTLNAGQLDLLMLWLGLEAYHRRKSPVSGVLMAIGLAVKPQAALFWVLPWLWGMENWRSRFKTIAVGAVVFLAPMLIWVVIEPARVLSLWQAWWNDGIRVNAGAYVGDSPSLWSANLPVLAIVALLVWLITGASEKVSRPWLALGLPALRYYSTVALMGAVPAWGVALGYATVALTYMLGQPVFWIEPLVMVIYLGYTMWRGRLKVDQTPMTAQTA